MKIAIVVAAIFAVSPWTYAADKKHDDAHARHGGVAVEAGAYHLELVVKDKELTVHLNDHDDKPVETKGVKASASVFSGKDKGNVELAPAGGNLLKGTAGFALGKESKVVVSFTLPGKKPEQARFQLGKPQEHKGHKH